MRLSENSKDKEKALDNKKTSVKQVKKISKSQEIEIIETNIEENANTKAKSAKKNNDNEEIIVLDSKDEIEITDEINNSRKKRRRSSASVE